MKSQGLPAAILAFAAGAAFTCSSPSGLAGGSGHEWEAKTAVRGIIVDTSGVGASSTVVKLVPAGYSPLSDQSGVRAAVADGRGEFSFQGVPRGRYAVEAAHPASGLRCRVSTSVDTFEVAVPPETLKTPGRVVLPLPENSPAGIVYVPGTTVRVSVRASQPMVAIDSLAPGTLQSVLFAAAGDTVARSSLAGSLAVRAGMVDSIADLVIYNDDTTIVTGTYPNPDTLVRDTAGAGPGKRPYKFTYTIRNWSATFGLNLDNWTSTPPYDVSPYRAVRFSSRGSNPAHGLYLYLIDATRKAQQVRACSIPLSPGTAEVPLSSYQGLDLKQLREMMFLVSDADTGSGVLYVNNVRFSTIQSIR